jgi:hypothetical protein
MGWGWGWGVGTNASANARETTVLQERVPFETEEP